MEFAVKLEGISKVYRLYDRPSDRVKEALIPWSKARYKPFHALKNVNVAVKPGEIIGLVGKNGSGKSTLLKILAGIIQPTAGTVLVNGRISAILELSAGFNPEFTGYENIYFYAAIMGFSQEYMKKRVESIIEFADIGPFIYQPLKNYSSGMKSRLAFAVSTAIEPKILIVDEALSVGDALFAKKCFDRIYQLIENNCTVFFVSHSNQAISEFCSRAYLLHEGEIITEGNPKIVLRDYQNILFNKNFNHQKVKALAAEKGKGLFDPFKTKTPIMDQEKFKNTESADSDYFFNPNFKIIKNKNKLSVLKNIINYRFTDPQGNEVNQVKTGLPIEFSCQFIFVKDWEEVFVSLRVLNHIGQPVAIFSYSKEHVIKSVKSNSSYNYNQKFICQLNPGIYFVTIHVASKAIKDASVNTIYALNDGLCLKVIPNQLNSYLGYYCSDSEVSMELVESDS